MVDGLDAAMALHWGGWHCRGSAHTTAVAWDSPSPQSAPLPSCARWCPGSVSVKMLLLSGGGSRGRYGEGDVPATIGSLVACVHLAEAGELRVVAKRGGAILREAQVLREAIRVLRGSQLRGSEQGGPLRGRAIPVALQRHRIGASQPRL